MICRLLPSHPKWKGWNQWLHVSPVVLGSKIHVTNLLQGLSLYWRQIKFQPHRAEVSYSHFSLFPCLAQVRSVKYFSCKSSSALAYVASTGTAGVRRVSHNEVLCWAIVCRVGPKRARGCAGGEQRSTWHWAASLTQLSVLPAPLDCCYGPLVWAWVLNNASEWGQALCLLLKIAFQETTNCFVVWGIWVQLSLCLRVREGCGFHISYWYCVTINRASICK